MYIKLAPKNISYNVYCSIEGLMIHSNLKKLTLETKEKFHFVRDIGISEQKI
jgi:hypothetical protein